MTQSNKINSQKKEIGTAYIIEKGISRKVILHDFSDLKIIDEILIKNKKSKQEKKEKQNLYSFLQPKR